MAMTWLTSAPGMHPVPPPARKQFAVSVFLAVVAAAGGAYLLALLIPQFSDPAATITSREVTNPLFLFVASGLLVRKAWRQRRVARMDQQAS